MRCAAAMVTSLRMAGWTSSSTMPKRNAFLAPFLTREDDVEGRAGANQPGEPLAAARPRENAELHFREAELSPGVIGGHAVPAGEGELEPAAEARAVNPGGDRFGEARRPAQHVLALG